jgi:hypothetical protein
MSATGGAIELLTGNNRCGFEGPVCNARIAAAAGVIVHLAGVTIQDVEQRIGANQHVVSTSGVVEHGKRVAIEGLGSNRYDQRVIGAV